MSRENQIVKIADILLESSRQDSRDKSNSKAYTAFDTATVFKYGCDRLNGATAIYDAGYREQIEGELETIPDYSRALITYRHICGVCGCSYKDIRPNGHKYCHECGAKMKGV